MKSHKKNLLQLRTPVKIPPATFQITHKNSIFCLGSCFATHIFEMLQYSWFTTKRNPAGITYNPLSIATQIQWLLDTHTKIPEPILVNNQWIPFEFHGSFRKKSKEETMKFCNQSIDDFRTFFAESSIDIYTFGTSFIYEYDNKIVNNCHKIPAKYFDSERLLRVSEIIDLWSQLLEDVFAVFPQKQIILTLSPVRHTRNGLIGNSVSKSILRTCIHELTQIKNVHYFPSYEILLDELRDYRFYREDMLHPSSLTIQYIWNHFVTTYMSDTTRTIIEDIEKVQRMKEHRFIQPTEEEIIDYRKKIQQKEELIKKRLHL
jgi:hypothetical protein